MNSIVLDVLSEIEKRESGLLVWGVVDGSLESDELRSLIDPILDEAIASGDADFVDSDELISTLIDKALLFQIPGHDTQRYRSRSAETIRLLSRLRQLFPQHHEVDGWQNANTLVADYRYSLRKRRYPKRDIPLTDLVQAIRESAHGLSLPAFETLLSGGNGGMRLARFQVEACARIAVGIGKGRSSGTLVSAGTGSGKTLTFYLPVLSRVFHCKQAKKSETGWVKAIAIYPRTELLRDQLNEILKEARKLNRILVGSGHDPIRLGALFGGTPWNSRTLKRKIPSGWHQVAGGYTCGLISCPDCSGEMVWGDSDVDRGRELITCENCGSVVDGSEFALTRTSLFDSPPDVLFTTTEMLNSRMSDGSYAPLFGVKPYAKRPPEFILLDEIHTYSGAHGAQVAYLMRRWRRMIGARVNIVGLSATLSRGEQFFEDLTGLITTDIREIKPAPDDLISEGAEYVLALRGDPVSRATLLATSIQTAMLVSRMLDCPDGSPSAGVYGSKIFAFTDDIDVTNRLYFSLLDAEGRNDRGEPNFARHPDGGLAVLRRTIPSLSRERYGQNWWAAESIGHSADERKRIGRTSSQDPGVAGELDTIVATASLEVGFNDPSVGAVIQHRAPRDAAQFIQRKGRAGRSRGMRPWTVVVLSDYGRDRLAYRAYEKLFDPELTRRFLPLTSRHILRMQAVYVLFEYLHIRLTRNVPLGSVWQDLSRPYDRSNQRKVARVEAIVRSLSSILRDSEETDKLGIFLGKALNLTKAETQAVMWESPRPLMTTVVPTALRRLSTNWRSAGADEADYWQANSPLPEFAPSNLFSELNLPEVIVRISGRPGTITEDSYPMPVLKALRTFAPGRVSRRFGISRSFLRHWVCVDQPTEGENAIEVGDHYSAYPLGEWLHRVGSSVSHIEVLRPVEIRPMQPGRVVGDTSNALLNWKTQIVCSTAGLKGVIPANSCWRDILESIEFFTHGAHCPVEVRRFATGSDADIKLAGGAGQKCQFTFCENQKPVALGYSIDVDAVRFQVRSATVASDGMRNDRELVRVLRTKRYFDMAWGGEGLAIIDNPFQRQWLATIYLAAITFEALVNRVSLEVAEKAVANHVAQLSLGEVLESIFQSSKPVVTDEEEGEENGDRLRQELEGLLGRKDVQDSLRELSLVLWQDVDTSWDEWLHRNYVATLAASALEAIQSMCPEIDTEGIVVDVDPGPRGEGDIYQDQPSGTEFWISETNPGGNGQIESVFKAISDNPRKFYALWGSALRPNEYEQIDAQLRRFLKDVRTNNDDKGLVDSVRQFRAAPTLSQTESSFADIRAELSKTGYIMFHGFLSALSSRLLRPGSSGELDDYIRTALSEWDAEEERLGIEIDLRTISFVLSQDAAIDQVVSNLGLSVPNQSRRFWRFNAIYGLLWSRGGEIRKAGLHVYNPFSEIDDAEPMLVLRDIDDPTEVIDLTTENWEQEALEVLGRSGAIRIQCPIRDGPMLSAAFRFFGTNPVESDYLLLFACIESVRREGDFLAADIVINEVSVEH